ncbi:Uncharacterized protein SCF082_LOCUS635 [Durusdinium trenchii]|uniref:Uncharacterized protein n=1 Tax=Durusdinium trenchii TaxID=1381693 RepID=A0ABP0H8S2_9DINO
MIQTKKKRTDLSVPGFVKEQWEKGTAAKDELAQLLIDVNWAKDAFLCELEQVIKKIKKIQLTRDEGWYSEAELKEANRYDGIQELWVVVRETATHAEIQEADEGPQIAADSFAKIDAFAGQCNNTAVAEAVLGKLSGSLHTKSVMEPGGTVWILQQVCTWSSIQMRSSSLLKVDEVGDRSIAKAMEESPEEELWDLLTCHRDVSW